MQQQPGTPTTSKSLDPSGPGRDIKKILTMLFLCGVLSFFTCVGVDIWARCHSTLSPNATHSVALAPENKGPGHPVFITESTMAWLHLSRVATLVLFPIGILAMFGLKMQNAVEKFE